MPSIDYCKNNGYTFIVYILDLIFKAGRYFMTFKTEKNSKGFSLIEVLVIVLIIGILSAIALPMYRFSVERSRAVNSIATLNQIAKAQLAQKALKGSYSATMGPLALEFTDSNGAEVSGDTFEDEYFNYTIDNNMASASRKIGTYELQMPYDTGELVCLPEGYRLCKILALMSAQSEGGNNNNNGNNNSQSQEAQEVNNDNTNNQNNNQSLENGLVCNEGVCEYYVNGEKFDSCDAADLHSCFAQFRLSGLVCNEEGLCQFYREGEKQEGERRAVLSP